VFSTRGRNGSGVGRVPVSVAWRAAVLMLD
jgi:hypothetical protein